MGRHVVHLDNDRWLVVGYDGPFKTFYFQLYDPSFERHDEGAPLKVAGYHPMERGIPPIAGSYDGPYPLTDFGDIDRLLIDWGLTGDQREEVGRALARDHAST